MADRQRRPARGCSTRGSLGIHLGPELERPALQREPDDVFSAVSDDHGSVNSPCGWTITGED